MSVDAGPCPSEEQLIAFSEGSLPEDERQALERHARTCRECFEVLAALGSNPSSAPAATATPLLARGTALGRYVLLEPLGAGSMGVVYAAYDPQLDRRVALKLLHPSLHGGSSGSSGGAQARLLREAQALARLAHPNVVSVFDVGTWREQIFLAMEYVTGGTLTQWLRERPWPWREVLRVLCDAGRGLAAAHAAGLVHRDFKPDNVLVGHEGRARITDFGLARALHDEPPPEAGTAVAPLPLDTALTRTGAVLGTPAYMAPEQLEGAPADAHSDQFSFCVALYESLYGERPFVARDAAELLEAVRAGQVRPPAQGRSVPTRVRRALLRGLSPHPQARFPSMEALLAELERDPARQRRRWLAGAAAVLALGAGVALVKVLPAMRAQACATGAERRLEQAWSEPRRAAVREAFARGGATESTLRNTEQALEAYAARWKEAVREACVATHVERSQPERVLALRLSCLDRAREDLRALGEVFASADATVVANAARASQTLPDLGACADWSALAALAPTVPAEQQPRLEALQSRLAEASALLQAGRYAAGLERAQALAKEAQAAGLPQAEAEAWFTLGRLQERRGEYAQAETSLHEAALAAERAGDLQLLARARTSLIGVVGARLMRYSEGKLLARYAEQAVERAGGSPALRAAYHTTVGMTYAMEERYSEAQEHYQRAVEYQEARGETGRYALAISLANLGGMQSMTRQYSQALTSLERALKLHQQLGTPEDLVAITWLNLSTVYKELGRRAEAVAAAEQAVAMYRRTLPPEHPSIYNSLQNLAEMYGAERRFEQAWPLFSEAAELARRSASAGPDSAPLASIERDWAEELLSAGRLQEAREHLERSLAIYRKALGEAHAETVKTQALVEQVRKRLASAHSGPVGSR